MKSYIIILLALVTTNVFCQTSFPGSGAIWHVHLKCPNEGDVFYGIGEDTVLNNITYSKVFELSDTTFNKATDKLLGLIRSENQRVLFTPEYGDSGEFTLYDFSYTPNIVTINHGVRVDIYNDETTFTPNEIVSERYGTGSVSAPKTYYSTTYIGQYSIGIDEWIEGIGSIKGLFWHLYVPPMSCNYEDYATLKCMKYNDTVRYFDDDRCNKCFCSFGTSIEEQDNCKWVNIHTHSKENYIEITIDKPYSEVLVEIINCTGTIVHKTVSIDEPIYLNNNSEILFVRLKVDNEVVVKKIMVN